MKARPQLILRLYIDPFWHSEDNFCTSMGSGQGAKMVEKGQNWGGGIGMYTDCLRGKGFDCGETFE